MIFHSLIFLHILTFLDSDSDKSFNGTKWFEQVFWVKILEQGLLYITSWWAGSVNEAKSPVTQH